jgi:hypothetical protein
MANKQFKVPINLVNLASDPGTASEGDIYYNTTSDVVRVYANGAWASVGSGGGSGSDSFKTIAIAGQSDVVADSSTDTLTIIEGNGITITTNANTDAITLGVTSSTYQPLDAELTALAGLTSAADSLPYFTGSGTASLATFTTFGRSLVDDSDQATARTTLGLGIGTDVQAYSATLAGINTLGSGTGFLKNTAGTWSYDNSTYLDTSATAQTKAGDLTVSTKVVTPRIENTADINIVSDAGSGSTNDISLATRYNTIRISDTSSAVFIDAGNSLGYGTWKFDKTLILFPDNSSQSTAFLGMSSYSTTNLSEGTNLYYTDERAQDAIGTILGSGLSYNDGTGAISNSGVLDLTGTANEIVVSGSTGSITIGIPDSPVFVTPNIGVATATSVNSTTIPSSKTLVVTTDIGSTVQGYSSTLAGINTLGSGTGFLKNTAGTFSYDNSTYITSAVTSLTGTANQIAASAGTGSVTLSLPSDVTIPGSLTVTGNFIVNGATQTVNSTTVTVDDPIITLGGDTAPESDDNKDRGVEFRWHNGTSAKVGFFGYDDSAEVFTFISDATNSSEVFSGTPGSIKAGSFETSDATGTASKTNVYRGTGDATESETVSNETTWASSTYSCAEYIVSISNGATGRYTSKVMLMSNGTTSSITEYAIQSVGTITTPTIAASTSASNLRLKITAASGYTITLVRTLVAV